MFPRRPGQCTCLLSGTVSAQLGFRRTVISRRHSSSSSTGYMSEITSDFPASWWYCLPASHTTYPSQPSLPCFQASINHLASWQVQHILCRAAEFLNYTSRCCACGNRSSNQQYRLNAKTLQRGDFNLRLKTRRQDTQSFPSLICEASPSMSRKKLVQGEAKR